MEMKSQTLQQHIKQPPERENQHNAEVVKTAVLEGAASDRLNFLAFKIIFATCYKYDFGPYR